MNYKELVANHKNRMDTHNARKRAIQDRINALDKRIAWNKKQLQKEWDNCPSWIDDIVFPFLAEVNKLLPDLVIKGEKITFGINCETPVEATQNGKTVFFSYLEPSADGLKYHTQKVLRKCPFGDYYETKPIESVEQYANYIKECITNENQQS